MPTSKGLTRHGGTGDDPYTRVEDRLVIPSGSTLQVDAGATATINGALDLNEATLTQSLNNALISIGDYDEQKEITMTASYIPFQINLASIANPTSGMSIACAYLRADAATADQANAQIVPLLVRSTLYFDVDSAYAIQSHLKIATSMATGASHANIAAGSFKVDLDAAVTQGNVQAGLFVIDGDGAVTEESCVVQLSCESGATVDTYLECGGSGTVSHLFSAGSNLYVATADAAADVEGSIPIKVGGATKYIQYWPSAT